MFDILDLAYICVTLLFVKLYSICKPVKSLRINILTSITNDTKEFDIHIINPIGESYFETIVIDKEDKISCKQYNLDSSPRRVFTDYPIIDDYIGDKLRFTVHSSNTKIEEILPSSSMENSSTSPPDEIHQLSSPKKKSKSRREDWPYNKIKSN